MIALTEELAQIIVNKMMKVIPYNVNLMNPKGIIIGSGDKKRIGKVHDGAIKAIISREMVAVYEEQGSVKPGVNMPIYSNGELVGVIGISGDPRVVSPFAAIVNVTAELLISQERSFKEQRGREQRQEEFLYQWAFIKDGYSEEFINRAKELGIDLSILRRAVTIGTRNGGKFHLGKLSRFLGEKEYYIRLQPSITLLFLKDDKNLYKRVRSMEIELEGGDLKNLNVEEDRKFSGSIKRNSIIIIGEAEEILGISVEKALRGGEIIRKLNLSTNFCFYKDIAPIDSLTEVKSPDSYLKLMEDLEKEGQEADLINTLISYINYNGEMTRIAKELHIHRNSLNYRLLKIHNITSKNPRDFKDLLELFTAYTLYKLK